MKEAILKPRSLPYPETTMYGALAAAAADYPGELAYEFMGKKTSYKKMIEKFDQAARAFVKFGLKRGDTVTICCPNVPQAITALYALNRLGVVASMVHPLSSQKEITYYLDDTDSKMIITLDLFYDKVAKAREEAKNPELTILTARMTEELPPHLAAAFYLKKGKEVACYPDRDHSIVWKDFIKTGTKDVELPEHIYDPTRHSVLLYSGGTTGLPKGIMLSDFNFNVLGMQIREKVGVDFVPGLKFLSVMPIFHGFGLGIGIHTVLENGITSILVPQFTNESYAKLIVKKRPNFIAGVPTIYADLIKSETLKDADLSCLVGVFSGGDTLPPTLKNDFDEFLKNHNSTVQVREGYGLTECVTASCITPLDTYKEGSIGLPLRDMVYRVVVPGTFNDVPPMQEGEIIISGPTVMLGYLNHPEETEQTLKTDKDGSVWMFSGDMGKMDEDGYIYFSQRIKRMIVTSGYNVYPSIVEDALNRHPDVDYSCVIGIPDPRRMQKIRAYIVLKEGVTPSEELKASIMEHCKLHLAIYAKPREIIFRDELPRTLVGKVAFRVLEEEAEQELKNA